MTRAILPVAAALAAMIAPAEAAVPWVGTWAAQRSWCSGKDFEKQPIVIIAKGYEGLENRCRFIRIQKRGSEWRLQARCRGEGRDYSERYIYRMQGNNLVIAYPDRGGAHAFVRCR